MQYSRREFIRAMSLTAGSLLLLPACGRMRASDTEYRFFNREEAACLAALCEQIIPADEDPGAAEAGAVHFIDRQIYLRFPEEKDLFKDGMASLQAWCRANHGQVFDKLSPSLQLQVMHRMDDGELDDAGWTVSPGDFFWKLRQRTMQAFYGSPRHGGNKDYCSYRMLKLDYPLLVGQNRYAKG
jgi:gluconate 2-dehydrogenase gamma chain